MSYASDKQIAYIRALGGTPSATLMSEQASELIDSLVDKPPNKQHVQLIELLGGAVPKTRREAAALCRLLAESSDPSDKQRALARTAGLVIPESFSYAEAEEMLGPYAKDADEEGGKPPTKSQLNRIAKLGGDASATMNRWRADELIYRLEEKEEEFTSRVDDVLECNFSYADMCSMRKPSKKVMAQALKYGDLKGWAEDWDTDVEHLEVAIYCVAPELLKKGEPTPSLNRGRHDSEVAKKGCGCFTAMVALVGASLGLAGSALL